MGKMGCFLFITSYKKQSFAVQILLLIIKLYFEHVDI